jgi:hypothetical protein
VGGVKPTFFSFFSYTGLHHADTQVIIDANGNNIQILTKAMYFALESRDLPWAWA